MYRKVVCSRPHTPAHLARASPASLRAAAIVRSLAIPPATDTHREYPRGTVGDSLLFHLTKARGWIADCYWRDRLEWYPEMLTDEEVMRGVERHYIGGWERFARDIEI